MLMISMMNELRRPVFTLAASVAALLVLSACAPVGGATVNASSQAAGVHVTGTGKMTVTPDIATLNVGVEARAVSVTSATERAQSATDAVVVALKSSGVEEKDIKTVQYSITPDRRFDRDGKEQVLGYIVQNRVRAKIRKIEDTGKTIEAVTKAGGDLIRIDGVSFSVEEPEKYQQSLRDKAMADAKARAEGLVKHAGSRLGKATYISENSNVSTPFPVPPNALRSGADGSSAPSVSPGEMEVQLQVQVVYEIQ